MSDFSRSSEPVAANDPIVHGKKWLGALKLIDVMLTTAEGDNVPRGEAVKMRVRLLARQVVGWRPPQDIAAARREIIEAGAQGCALTRGHPDDVIEADRAVAERVLVAAGVLASDENA